MRISFSCSLLAIAALLIGGCGNSVSGPRRLVWAGNVDDGTDKPTRGCPEAGPAAGTTSPIDLTGEFYDRACASLRDEINADLARKMIDAGITLTRMRCSDFFTERAANQTRERLFRGAVAPVSALITGIIGIAKFKSDAGRQEAIQILGIGEAATVAGLELYESEFLFGADNINSVRTLTMRALDEHANGILAANTSFFSGTRHLIDHQMICTPANILALSQAAIREGRVAPRTPIETGAAAVDPNRAVISMLGSNLRVGNITADQLGALWWLAQSLPPAAAPDQPTLAVLQDRLSGLPLNPIGGSPGTLTVDNTLITPFAAQLGGLSADIRNGFLITRRLIEQKIAAAAPGKAIETAKDIRFQLPAGLAPDPSRAVEVDITSSATNSN